MSAGGRDNSVLEISPAAARELQDAGTALVDIRDPEELIDGTPQEALNIPVSKLLAEGAGSHPALIPICGSGKRSMETAAKLASGCEVRLYSVSGGYAGWQQGGLPVDRSSCLDKQAMERYRRQLILPGMGIAGQKKLQAGRVLVIGAGGLGSPALTYLAAAGVGCLGIVDDDRVDRSNLQRQILHRDDRIGELKTESARRTLTAINPDIQINIHTQRLTRENADELLSGYEIVVDGSDNLATRYLLNDHCARLGLPLVYGAVLRFEGQVSVFWPGRDKNPCYQCLFPDQPGAVDGPSCAEAGVLGVTPAVVGSLQATEVLKLLLGTGRLLTGRLLKYDALQGTFTETRVPADPGCSICAATRRG
jgi:molybdopterin/thiamine biosynthesis adenylyltransferase/rhodanese-related sulfurtransferase